MVGGGGPEDTASEFEKRLRPIVGVAQMIVPATLFGGLIFHILGLEIPVAITGPISVVVGLLGIVSYLAGGWLCLRMRGIRKFFGICSYSMLALSSLSMLGMETSARQAELPEARLKSAQESPHYQRIQEQLRLATLDLERLILRTSLLPGDQRTQAAAGEAAKNAARQEISRLGTLLRATEVEAQGTENTMASGPFDLFGSGYAEIVRWIMMVLLTFGNESTSLSLLIPVRTRRSLLTRMITNGVVQRQIAGPVSNEARQYFEVAQKLGMAGRVAGYRRVASELGLSDHHARSLMTECLESGLIYKGRVIQTEEIQSNLQKLRKWLKKFIRLTQTKTLKVKVASQ